MSFESTRLAIEKKFFDEWNAETKIVFDNMKYTPVPGTPYVRLSIDNIASRQASLGANPLYRDFGLIFITAFVPEHDGTKNIRDYLDTAAAIFRGKSFSGIVCRAPYQASPGQVTNGWYRMSVAVPYFYDGVY